MFLPESVVLMYYLPRNTFIDKVSEEKSTGVIKPKYKLLFKHHKEMDVFVFFVLTTKQSACVKERTFTIEQSDWEDRQGYYLSADYSYIDVQNHIVMNKSDVIEKANNPNKGFSYAGKIYQTKFTELTNKVQKYISSATHKTDFTVRDILREIVLENKTGGFITRFKI